MTARQPNRPQPPVPREDKPPRDNHSRDSHPGNVQSESISKQIIDTINNLDALQNYDIRILVKHAEKLGEFLARRDQDLKTNQIRKFLDAINQIKAQLAQGDIHETTLENENDLFSRIEPDIVLLKPKLAYAAARQKAAKPLSGVMSAAIDKVYSLRDFERLVQLIESIIAYHKAAGGKNQ